MSDLNSGIDKKVEDLNVAIRKLRETGTDFAAAERDYKIVLRSAALELRDAGMAVGMIDKTIYGDKRVAEARFNRDVKETIYNANREAINTIKLELRILSMQWSAEWGATKYDPF